jgi:hypothetical protein
MQHVQTRSKLTAVLIKQMTLHEREPGAAWERFLLDMKLIMSTGILKIMPKITYA